MSIASPTSEALHGLQPARLVDIRDESPTLCSVTLEIADFDFCAGQSLMLDCGAGPVEAPISSDPVMLPLVRVTVRGDQLPPASKWNRTIRVAGPCGGEWPLMELLGRDILMIGQGLGIASILPLVLELVRVRESVGRLTLVVGTVDDGVLPFRDELLQVSAEHSIDLLVADASEVGDGGLAELAEESFVVSGRAATACVAASTSVASDVVDRLRNRGLGSDLMHVASACHWQCQDGECGRCRHGPNQVDRVGAVARADRWRPTSVPRVLASRRTNLRA